VLEDVEGGLMGGRLGGRLLTKPGKKTVKGGGIGESLGRGGARSRKCGCRGSRSKKGLSYKYPMGGDMHI